MSSRFLQSSLTLFRTRVAKASHPPTVLRSNRAVSRWFSSRDIFPNEPTKPDVKTEAVPGPKGREMVSKAYSLRFRGVLCWCCNGQKADLVANITTCPARLLLMSTHLDRHARNLSQQLNHHHLMTPAPSQIPSRQPSPRTKTTAPTPCSSPTPNPLATTSSTPTTTPSWTCSLRSPRLPWGTTLLLY
jgi:hypothetical protein